LFHSSAPRYFSKLLAQHVRFVQNQFYGAIVKFLTLESFSYRRSDTRLDGQCVCEWRPYIQNSWVKFCRCWATGARFRHELNNLQLRTKWSAMAHKITDCFAFTTNFCGLLRVLERERERVKPAKCNQ